MTKHMCGLQGYNPMLGDRCPGCDDAPSMVDLQEELMKDSTVDPNDFSMYDGETNTVKSRSTTMSNEELEIICEYCGDEGHWEEDCTDIDAEGIDRDYYNVQDFLGKLESFLVDELDEECRGNVFLSETGEDSVAINILVGVPLEGSGLDTTVKQINVIIAPTDRDFLGSEGVTIHDNEHGSFETEEVAKVEKPTSHGWFDAAMSIFRND